MKPLLTLLLMLSFVGGFGQVFSFPSIKQNGHQIKDFVPEHWTILDSVKGDLNHDKLADAVIILQHADTIKLPKDTVNNDATTAKDTAVIQHRILLILFKNQRDVGYDLAEQSNSFIVSSSDEQFADGPPLMDDPYQEMKIKNGVLQIDFGVSYSMGSWYITNTSYKFRYQGGQFVLIGADYYSMHRASGDFENYSFNFLTKKRVLTKGGERTGLKRTNTKALRVDNLKTLQSFKVPFTWEVEKDIFL